MKKTAYSVALSLAMIGSAMAADLPSRRAPPVYIPPPVPVFTWTGFYVGADVGYEFGKTAVSVPAVGVGYNVGQTGAAIGGVHVGYNYELGNTLGAGLFGGGLVVGVEGDILGSNNTSTQVLPGGLDQHKGQIEGSVRGRLGLAVDRALFYVTGGAAFAQFKDQATLFGGGASDSFSTSRVGYTIGGGIEYAVTPNWLLRAEYRYSDFGKYALSYVNTSGGALFVHHVQEEKVLLGVSYLFSDPIAPVVARY